MRVISDLTTNHTGDKHEWFVGGERELYLFDESGDYESWWGIKSLPKLNWLSPELRKRLQATARQWLQPPHALDGWRVDVANMSGRTGATDVNAEVAPTLRQVLNEDSLLVAENFHDFRPDFRGWHGVMNYAGFSRPVWTWLRGHLEIPYFEMPVTMPRLGGAASVAAMRAFFNAAAPRSQTTSMHTASGSTFARFGSPRYGSASTTANSGSRPVTAKRRMFAPALPKAVMATSREVAP